MESLSFLVPGGRGGGELDLESWHIIHSCGMPTVKIENTVDFYQLHPENPLAAISPPLINFTVSGHHPGPLPHRQLFAFVFVSYLRTHLKKSILSICFFHLSISPLQNFVGDWSLSQLPLDESAPWRICHLITGPTIKNTVNHTMHN